MIEPNAGWKKPGAAFTRSRSAMRQDGAT